MCEYEKERRRRASILILVLWALGLVSVLAVYTAYHVRQNLVLLGRMEERNTLALIAEAGIKTAIAEIKAIPVEAEWLALKDKWSNNPAVFSDVRAAQSGSFTVSRVFSDKIDGKERRDILFGAADELGKINLNTASRETLARLVGDAGGAAAQRAEVVASSIVDWRDADSFPLPDGAENKYYHSLNPPYDCKDAPFETLEELIYVNGMDRLLLERLEPFITVHGPGRININTAPAAVLRAAGLSEEIVKKIAGFRRGEDEVIGTSDDLVFTDAADIAAQLSQKFPLSPEEAAELNNAADSGIFTVHSQYFGIQSAAILQEKEEVCRIFCVYQKNLDPEGEPPGWILSWRREYLRPE